MDVVDALYRLGGVASHRALVGATSRWHVRAAVEAGRITRVGRGQYVLPGTERALASARALNGVLSHVSAAQHLGLPVWRPGARPWVTVPRGRHVDGRRRRGTHVVRQDVESDGMSTTALQTVLDCARRLPLEEGLAVADSALRLGAVEREELVSAAARLPRPGRARVVAAAASGLADNPFESVVRAHALGVPGLRLVPQVQLVGYGRADLADVGRLLVVECDSFGFHAGRTSLLNDIERHNRAATVGASLIRFGYEHAQDGAFIVRTLREWEERPPRPHTLLVV